MKQRRLTMDEPIHHQFSMQKTFTNVKVSNYVTEKLKLKVIKRSSFKTPSNLMSSDNKHE